jgi:uncharacterized membrane protein YecN with MAPEG domain
MNISINSLNVSGIWFFLFILLYKALTLHVIRMRWVTKTGLGTGEDRRMLKAVRIHGNFAEYIPFVFLGLILMEVRGAGSMWLHSLYAAAFIGRVFIAMGITKTGNASPLRFIGNLSTHVVLLAAGIWNLVQSLN